MKHHGTSHRPEDVAYAMSLFSAVRRILRTRFAKGKKIDPSTWLHIETMKYIAEHDKPKMKDVADYLSITAPSATSLVRGLMKAGFVTSVTDATDRRASRLALTVKGTRELKQAIARGIQLSGDLFSALSNERFAELISTLEHIQKSAKG